MIEIIASIAIIGLTITNLYTLYTLFRVIILHKSKDLSEYSKLIDKPKKETPKEPNIIEAPLYHN